MPVQANAQAGGPPAYLCTRFHPGALGRDCAAPPTHGRLAICADGKRSSANPSVARPCHRPAKAGGGVRVAVTGCRRGLASGGFGPRHCQLAGAVVGASARGDAAHARASGQAPRQRRVLGRSAKRASMQKARVRVEEGRGSSPGVLPFAKEQLSFGSRGGWRPGASRGRSRRALREGGAADTT